MDASAVVSETDAAHSSEDEDQEWLSNSAASSQRTRLLKVDEETGASDTKNEQRQGEDSGEEMDDAADELYCANMDDEDEAWVYKHLRSGKEETIYLRVQQKNNESNEHGEAMHSEAKYHMSSQKQEVQISSNQSITLQHEQMKKALLLKPRNSDAVLSCPRCFTCVCMDCQQHEKYANQYRAMFVMNIGVNWNKIMVYDDAFGGLKLVPETTEGRNNGGVINEDAPDRIPHDLDHGLGEEAEETYYSVYCGYCEYEVAALDMKDEIYYFYGCIASA